MSAFALTDDPRDVRALVREFSETTLAVVEVLHRELGDDKYRPAPLLRQYVAAGRLGRKTGVGVYRYDR